MTKPKLLEAFYNHIAMVFRIFCESTSLHGYNYLYQVNSSFLRIIWVIVILVMTGLAVRFLAVQTNDYFEAGIVTTIESSNAPLTVSTSSYVLVNGMVTFLAIQTKQGIHMKSNF